VASRVYFISGIDGPVKIGVAVEPWRRLRQIQTGCPTRLVLIADIPGSFDQERYLHEFYRRERLGGEWFRRSRRLSAYLMELVESQSSAQSVQGLF
jgi:hypothetical protein